MQTLYQQLLCCAVSDKPKLQKKMVLFHASRLYGINKWQHYFLNSDEPELLTVGYTSKEKQLLKS
jgi:hypothetical protein